MPAERRAGAVVTIGRSYGAGGRTVAKMLSERFGIPYYDAALLSVAAEQCGLSRRFLAEADEKSAQGGAIYSFNHFENERFSSIGQIAYKAQREIIERLAEEGACIIVGRRADRILQRHGGLLSVFITAS
ncbi:MAG: cytidylate kinase-like family protein, partial [Clostridia bacterium]|nr:cytidylate kinase-like family protein [Clostridia bacterium]